MGDVGTFYFSEGYSTLLQFFTWLRIGIQIFNS